MFVYFISMSEPVPINISRACDSSLATVASLTTEENLDDLDIPDERFGDTFTSFKPWTTIVTVLATVNYVTRSSKSWIANEPRITWLNFIGNSCRCLPKDYTCATQATASWFHWIQTQVDSLFTPTHANQIDKHAWLDISSNVFKWMKMKPKLNVCTPTTSSPCSSAWRNPAYGSYGTYSSQSSTKYIKYIDVDPFTPLSKSMGCKRQVQGLGCARSLPDPGVPSAPEGCSVHKSMV